MFAALSLTVSVQVDQLEDPVTDLRRRHAADVSLLEFDFVKNLSEMKEMRLL